jgi:AraC family transcriptional regulator of adaptative response/methylated-DNA-[protein]-cysteine methyltransferase
MPSDYARVERAIRYLDEHAHQRPSLADVAASAGLSEFHFQRLFTRWAGISPKRFLQYQTLAHARGLLHRSRSVLGAAYDAGLSSAARLHDLTVTIDAVTPGELRRGGAGLTIAHGVHDTPFGPAFVATTPRGVCGLAFLDADGGRDEGGALAELREAWPGAELREDGRAAAEAVARVFARGGRTVRGADGLGATPLALFVRGTNFQVKVWEALLRVPEGSVVAYEELAAAAGCPSATRAVASAVARNPVAYLSPCLRVIRKTWAFGEYRWGAPR